MSSTAAITTAPLSDARRERALTSSGRTSSCASMAACATGAALGVRAGSDVSPTELLRELVIVDHGSPAEAAPGEGDGARCAVCGEAEGGVYERRSGGGGGGGGSVSA